MSRTWIFLHLLVLSIEDMKEGELSMAVILELAVTGGIHAVYTGHMPVLCLGFFLLAVGFCSGEKIGYGDGWLTLALGMWLTLSELCLAFFLSLVFCVLYAFCKKKSEVPLVPFLTLAYLIGECL